MLRHLSPSEHYLRPHWSVSNFSGLLNCGHQYYGHRLTDIREIPPSCSGYCLLFCLHLQSRIYPVSAFFTVDAILLTPPSRVGWYTRLIRRVLVRMFGFISTLITHSLLVTFSTDHTALSLIYTLSNSPLHTH
jgi:hypothetical protein